VLAESQTSRHLLLVFLQLLSLHNVATNEIDPVIGQDTDKSTEVSAPKTWMELLSGKNKFVLLDQYQGFNKNRICTQLRNIKIKIDSSFFAFAFFFFVNRSRVYTAPFFLSCTIVDFLNILILFFYSHLSLFCKNKR